MVKGGWSCWFVGECPLGCQIACHVHTLGVEAQRQGYVHGKAGTREEHGVACKCRLAFALELTWSDSACLPLTSLPCKWQWQSVYQ